MQYRLVIDPTTEINDLMARGFMPLGPPVIENGSIVQALCREPLLPSQIAWNACKAIGDAYGCPPAYVIDEITNAGYIWGTEEAKIIRTHAKS